MPTLPERQRTDWKAVHHAAGVNFSTAQRYVNQLEEAGLLREITGQARNRVHRADEVLRAIEEPLSPDGGAES
jgi:predicted transcriptional regulator